MEEYINLQIPLFVSQSGKKLPKNRKLETCYFGKHIIGIDYNSGYDGQPEKWHSINNGIVGRHFDDNYFFPVKHGKRLI